MLNPRPLSRITHRRSVPGRAPVGPRFEPLEARNLLSGYAWTNDEVYLLELVNRARANPMAEAARLGIDLTQSLTAAEIALLVPSEPLALNAFLTNAARAQSQDMGVRGYFNHISPEGLDPTQRAVAAGYSGSAGENIAGGYDSIDAAHLGWLESVGHRRNIFSLYSDFDASFHYSEFGAGMYYQTVQAGDTSRYTSYHTQEFGSQSNPLKYYILGVVYDDNNANNFYTPGEGRANVKVDVFTSLSAPVVASYITDAAGNYQVPVAPGTYTVIFTDLANGLSTSQVVTVGSANIKADARGNQLTTRIISDNFSGTNSVAYGSTNGADILTLTTIDRFGNAVAFRQASNGSWVVADLNLATGAAKPSGQLVTWTDPASGFTNAAAPSAGGLLLFVHNSNTNVWSSYNLTNLVAGSSIITSELTVFQDAVSGLTIIAGLNSGGEMVIYTKANTGPSWFFANLTVDEIQANGQVMPVLAGSLVGYATSWGGLNIAALDSAGDVQSVWWAPGMPHWVVNDLNDQTNAPAITGGLTVFQTPWGSINIAGIDVNGDVQDTWWLPGNSFWTTDNFNQSFGGPALRASSLASFVMPWGGLNLVGLDSAGKVWFYWWTPGLTTWQVTGVSDLIGGAVVSGTLRGVSSSVGTTSLLGKGPDGHVLRYWWAPGRANWEVQDLTLLT